MLSKFFFSQVADQKPGDWCLTVQSDLRSLNLESYTFTQISQLSKNHFKQIVDKAISFHALKYLNGEKEKLSKVKHIVFNRLKMEDYLLSTSQLSVKESKFMFLLKSRMLQVGCNYRGSLITTPICPICCDPSSSDDQQHLLVCDQLSSNDLVDDDIVYDDLFSTDLAKQTLVMRILMKNFERRKDKLLLK